ncbi:hypothetical protein GX48_07352 [Paracoccidioides brasiliensis]|nr:hypothetical protein GX48_07352 [Paracoccidioides brasiliensis]
MSSLFPIPDPQIPPLPSPPINIIIHVILHSAVHVLPRWRPQISRSTLLAMRQEEAVFHCALKHAYAARNIVPPRRNRQFYINRKRVQPYWLFFNVFDRGGFNHISLDKISWYTVSKFSGITDTQATTFSWNVIETYRTWLLPLEHAVLPAGFTYPLPGTAAQGQGLGQGLGQAQLLAPLQAFPHGLQPVPSHSQSYTHGLPGNYINLSSSPFFSSSSSSSSQFSSTHTPTPSYGSSNSSNPATASASTNMSAAATPAMMDTMTPMHTIMVDTPANQRGIYAPSAQQPPPLPIEPLLRSMIPDTVPKIYSQCLRSLEVGSDGDRDFALHHLVVISDERGDKFKFEDFGGLAEYLTDLVMRITRLISGVTWFVDYNGRREIPYGCLAVSGTEQDPHIVERVAGLPVIIHGDDHVEDAESARTLRWITEAALVLRNMSMLEANARYLSEMPIFKNCLLIVLSSPRQPRFNEALNHMLDTLEQVCPYWETDENDPLLPLLLPFVDSNDRYHVVTALKIIVLYSMELTTFKRLGGLPGDKLLALFNYSYLEQDKELLSMTLDFFYQYTATPENINEFIYSEWLHHMVPRMVSLLLIDSNDHVNEIVDQEEHKAPPTTSIPPVPQELKALLLHIPEPGRCARWLSCLFIEDAECEITQLALWKAYQDCFAADRSSGGIPTLAAADFINAVSATFSSAQAQVVPGPSARFIIKGIRPLEAAYHPNGYPYFACRWSDPSPICKIGFTDPAQLHEHVIRDHLHLGPEDAEDQLRNCGWESCKTHRKPSTINVNELVNHVYTHLPALKDMALPPAPPPGREIIQPRISRTFDYYPTPVDENGDPIGIAYKAVLILRNIIRNLPHGNAGPSYGFKSWNYVFFFAYRNKLIEIADYNPTLRGDIFDLVDEIESS